jgi:hypothetical protein
MDGKLASSAKACLAAVTAVIAVAACGGGGDDNSGGTVIRVTEAATLSTKQVNNSMVANPVRWMPSVTDTWQLQLQGKLDTSYNVAVYVLDLFDTPPSTIASLKEQGRRVVCYFSAEAARTGARFPEFPTLGYGQRTQRLGGRALAGYAIQQCARHHGRAYGFGGLEGVRRR